MKQTTTYSFIIGRFKRSLYAETTNLFSFPRSDFAGGFFAMKMSNSKAYAYFIFKIVLLRKYKRNCHTGSDKKKTLFLKQYPKQLRIL